MHRFSPWQKCWHPVGMTSMDTDLLAADVAWDLSELLEGVSSPSELVETAAERAAALQQYKGQIATMSAAQLAVVMEELAGIHELLSRAGHYVSLRFAENTGDPERGARMQAVNERSNEVTTSLLFIDLEWAGAPDDHAQQVLKDRAVAAFRHHLDKLRKARPYLLSEPEETVLAETSLAGSAAWVRLFEEQTSAIEVDAIEPISTTAMPLMQALSLLQHPEEALREQSAQKVTQALAPGLRTRAFIYNTLMLDKKVDDRLRGYPTWISSRNLANEASDESVQTLIDAVVGRYDIPQRWYKLKATVLGTDKLRDYDRMASVAQSATSIGWSEATQIVRNAYSEFSGELGSVVSRFIDESWIDAPVRPGKRGGAFCAYGVPSQHPYVLLNWTSTPRDVATLAHELGHGVHGYLARGQGIFHQSTPLTLAETASVFGETLTNHSLLAMLTDPAERFALLAATLEDSIATVFRQVAMNRFENECHTLRRTEGELSVEQFNEVWARTQTQMLGPSVEITEGYRTWWSYIPHFIATPGYVYAYAYGQLLALSVYARYQAEGPDFVPAYLQMLSAGGSMSPEEITGLVGCDLTDPGFWQAGLEIVDGQLTAAEEAAKAAGHQL
jgi:oligoendopeptidase F